MSMGTRTTPAVFRAASAASCTGTVCIQYGLGFGFRVWGFYDFKGLGFRGRLMLYKDAECREAHAQPLSMIFDLLMGWHFTFWGLGL